MTLSTAESTRPAVIAKPFRTLPMYFVTAPTAMPPSEFATTGSHVQTVQAAKRPETCARPPSPFMSSARFSRMLIAHIADSSAEKNECVPLLPHEDQLRN